MTESDGAILKIGGEGISEFEASMQQMAASVKGALDKLSNAFLLSPTEYTTEAAAEYPPTHVVRIF
ncbi:MAG: hypothetical protein AAGU11_18710 [Syntrophobacteraceae bacterium]